MKDLSPKARDEIKYQLFSELLVSLLCNKILFLNDGKIFNKLEKGDKQRKEFQNEILDVLALLGGDTNVR